MIAEMYKRREKAGYVFLGTVIGVIIGWIFINPPVTTREWFEMSFFLLPLGMILAIILISRSHYNKVKAMKIQTSAQPLLDLNHVILKKDIGLIPRLLLFEKDGTFIGMIKPLTIRWWMLPFRISNELMLDLFPLTFGFVSHNGETLFTFRKSGLLKQVTMTIFDHDNQKIGTYIQEELKALVHIKGRLLNENEEKVLSIKASGFSGDFSWNDEDGHQWAHFYNGKFPHKHTTIFRDFQNNIVELSDQISKKDKTRLLAIIGYLFLARVKQ